MTEQPNDGDVVIDLSKEPQLEAPQSGPEPSTEQAQAKTPDQPGAEREDPQKAIDDMRKRLEQSQAAERQAREDAQRAHQAAQQALQQRQEAETRVQDGQMSAILNAISANEAMASEAERAYADALQSGDYAAAAKAQRAMSGIEARLVTLNRGKESLEDARKNPQPQRHEQPQFQPTQGRADPVEQIASQLPAKSAAWVRSHPQAASEWNKVLAAHQGATALKGFKPESDEYFAYVEEQLGYGEPQAGEPAPQPTPQRRQSVPSAPVSQQRSTPGKSFDGRTMVLSAAERDVARSIYSDLSPEDAERAYALNKADMIKQGRMAG